MQTKNHVTSKSGVISKDEKWFGDILIEDNVVIAHGVSVTVLPGAKIKFAVKKSYPENKEYSELNGRLHNRNIPNIVSVNYIFTENLELKFCSLTDTKFLTKIIPYSIIKNKLLRTFLFLWVGKPFLYYRRYRWKIKK